MVWQIKKKKSIWKISCVVCRVLFGEFVNLLKWKDTQGLLFCMFDIDEYDCKNDNDIMIMIQKSHIELSNQLVSPLWTNFSRQLTTLYDPILSEFNKL